MEKATVTDYAFPITLSAAAMASVLQSAITREFISGYDSELTMVFEEALAFSTAVCVGYLGYTTKSYLQKDKVALDKQSKADIVLAGLVLCGSIVYGNIEYGAARTEWDFYGTSWPS
jgi:hypothetical protein